MLKVVSGGQTGSIARRSTPRGPSSALRGWCPAAAWPRPDRRVYPLVETPSADYAQRTEWNVRDSEGTLVVARGRVTGGTALTIALARRHAKPLLVVDLARHPSPQEVSRWIGARAVGVLNVAGPRESQRPGIGREAGAFLERLFRLTSTRG
jgi:hypothetical protein